MGEKEKGNMAFYKDFSKKPSNNKQSDWRDDAKTYRPGQKEGGRPSRATRSVGGDATQQRDAKPVYADGFAPIAIKDGQAPRAQGGYKGQGAGRPVGNGGGRGSYAPRSNAPQAGRDDARPAYGQREGGAQQGFAPRGRAIPRPVYGKQPPMTPDFGREEQGSEAPENLLVGRNPIREAVKSGRDIERLLIARGELIGSAREIVAMARDRRIVVQEVDRVRLDAIAPNHQGMVAFASAFQYSTLEEMLELAKERGEDPFLVILDGVTDPHNLGAVIRSAECAGAHGVLIPERRAVGLTPAAAKASAGAIEHLKVARIMNMSRLVEQLKTLGVWTYAATMDGEPYDRVNLSGPIALIVGSEGDGVSRLVQEKCDAQISLPINGKIDSLNASVAAGILMYAIVRARA